MIRRIALSLLFVVAAASAAFAQATPGPSLPAAIPIVQAVERSDAATNVQHSHSTGATITLTAGAAGGPQGVVYVTGLDISSCENGTGAAAASPLYITTSGFNGNPQYQVEGGTNNAGVLGTCQFSVIAFTAPLKSQTSGTSPTFILPTFASGQTISVNVYYRLGAQ